MDRLRQLWPVHPYGGRPRASTRRGHPAWDLGACRLPCGAEDGLPDVCRLPRRRMAAPRLRVDEL